MHGDFCKWVMVLIKVSAAEALLAKNMHGKAKTELAGVSTVNGRKIGADKMSKNAICCILVWKCTKLLANAACRAFYNVASEPEPAQ